MVLNFSPFGKHKTMMNPSLLYSGTVLIWGSTWLAIRFQLGVVSPEISLVYRFGIASLLLLVWYRVRGLPTPTGWRNHSFLILLGACLFSFNYLLFYIAAENLATGLLAVIFSTMTVMNILNGTLFLGRQVEGRIVLGSGFGLAGICLVFWPEVIALDKAHNVFLAVLLGVIATYFASLGNIISVRNQKSGIEVIPGNAFGMLYGTTLMTLYVLISDVHFNFDPSFGYISSLMYLSLFGSALAFTLYLTLVGKIGPEKAAYATVLFPIVALTLSTLFENYRWSALAGIGVLLVLIGNVIVLTNRHQFHALLNRLNFPLP
jgi:drug/metabolite transporter (DMT)-like permease